MVRQRNRRIHSGSGFFGSFDAPWSEISCIDLSGKETQNPFSDSFGFKNPVPDFLKETHPNIARAINTNRKDEAVKLDFSSISCCRLHSDEMSCISFSMWICSWNWKRFLQCIRIHVFWTWVRTLARTVKQRCGVLATTSKQKLRISSIQLWCCDGYNRPLHSRRWHLLRKGYEILFALWSGRQTLFNVRRSCAQQGKKNIVVLVLSKITSHVQPRLRVSFETLWHVCVIFYVFFPCCFVNLLTTKFTFCICSAKLCSPYLSRSVH